MDDGTAPVRIAMMLYGDLTYDSRVQREANALVAAGHDVRILCLAGAAASIPMLDPRVSVITVRAGGRPESGRAHAVRASRGVRRYVGLAGFLLGYARGLRAWTRAAARHAADADVMHGHDFTGLVAASMARRPGTALVYDMHDLFLDTEAGARLPRPVRAALLWYERRLARRVDLLVTVNNGLATWAREHLRVPSVAVVHNCVPRSVPLVPRPTRIRDALGLAASDRIVLYHGVLSADRGIETLMEAMRRPGLERAHLVLLGFGRDRDRFADAARDPRFGGRVHLLDAVPPDALGEWVASADVGVMPNLPRNLNERLSTPNKLFESLAAGIPVVSSDFPERRRIIIDDPLGPLGAVCDPSDADALAIAIRSIVELDDVSLAEARDRSARAARERWNWETEAAVLVDAYRAVADGPRGTRQ